MKGDFEVRYTAAAREELIGLFDFLVMRAETRQDFDAAQLAVDSIRTQVESNLSSTPFIFRKATQSPFLRELVIPFGAAGYVALYEIDGASSVNILAIRHQLEEDYH